MPNKKANILNIAFIVLFFSTLIGCAVVSIYKEDAVKSVQENRYLSQFNSPSFETLWNGTWFQDFESYNKDQFISRDHCMQMYYLFLDALNVAERNGYVRGIDNHILPVNEFEVSASKMEEAKNYGTAQVDAMSKIAAAANNYGGNVIYMNVPHKVEYFADMYPSNYNNNKDLNDTKRASIIKKAKEANITVVETYDILLSHSDEYVYFTTDNHWTIRGAYYAYKELLNCINRITPSHNLMYPAYQALNIEINAERMIGSYLKKWGDSGIIDNDYMEYAVPYDMPEFIRYDNDTISQRPLFDSKKTLYTSFMDGDIANTVIDTGRSDLPSILFIGFSYSNPLEVMSVYNFNSVESIDPRHWDGSICDYVKQSQPDYIVIVRDDIYEGNSEFSCKVE